MAGTEIVVGVDGSVPSLCALRFAAQEAQRRQARLRIITAYSFDWPSVHLGLHPETTRGIRQHYTGIVADALRELRIIAPDVCVTGQSVEDDPARALLRAAGNAGLLVVGNRGAGGFRELLLGSVSQRVATHADIPVVVVRGPVHPAGRQVVVGVERTDDSAHVLATAFEEASIRGVGLLAVHAYGFAVPPLPASVIPLSEDPVQVRRHEAARLRELLAPWREKFPDVAVRGAVSRSGPSRILVETSVGADLVVIGSRGHGAVLGALLGSVGLQLIQHAGCPVLIVH